MMAIRRGLLLAALPVLAAVPVHAADKSQYSLFNPTPNALLRGMTTDRPDLTESPFTVDAGHVQFEINAAGFSRSRRDSEGARTDTFEFGTTNMRVGLTNNAEINIVLQPYGIVRNRPRGGPTTHDEGIGALDIRGKLNLFGNDSFEMPGDTALGLLPFITLPTDSGNGVSPEDIEYGLIVPFAVVLPAGFGLGINGGVTAIKDEDGSGHHAEYLASLALAYEWTTRFSTYYEIAAVLGTDDPRGDILLLGTGFTYAPNKNLQFDGGINFGVTSASDHYNPFIGVTRRY